MKTQTHAVVIGSGIAGLLAARVLSDHFDRVTIIERDRVPFGDEFRRGIPQARHVHVLHRRGQTILEQYFPGLEAEFAAAGVPCLDQGWDVLSRFKTGYGPRLRSGITVFSTSRTFLEGAIRRRVLGNQRVHLMPGCDVTGLLTDSQQGRVTGVQYRSSESPDETDYLLADAVMAADGRASRLPEWLEAIGYDRPQTRVVNPHLGYASRWYTIPVNFQTQEWQGILLQTTPPAMSRGAIVMPVEGSRWIVTLMGTNGDYPPTDEDGFLAFARSLPDAVIHDALKSATPLSAIYGYRNTENRLVYYDRLARWPENLMVIGDACCALNPSYGQGITMAALSAVTLDTHLCQRRPVGNVITDAHHFQKKLSKTMALEWQLAISQDVRWPSCEGGRRGLPTRLMHRLTDLIIQQMPGNPALYQLFLEIMHGLRTPSALFQPRVVGMILQGALRLKARSKTVREIIQPTV